MFGAVNTCVKLQSGVTSSGAIVVSLIYFSFHLGGWGWMGWLSFLIGQGSRGWEMLAGKGGWGKGLYGPFVVYGRCMDMLLKGFFLL